jgi:hypothetical protein
VELIRTSTRRVAALCSLGALIALWAAACTKPSQTRPSGPPAAHCIPFELLASDDQGIRVQLVFQAAIGGQPWRVQLDTGFQSSWVYGRALVGGSSSRVDGWEAAVR